MRYLFLLILTLSTLFAQGTIKDFETANSELGNGITLKEVTISELEVMIGVSLSAQSLMKTFPSQKSTAEFNPNTVLFGVQGGNVVVGPQNTSKPIRQATLSVVYKEFSVLMLQNLIQKTNADRVKFVLRSGGLTIQDGNDRAVYNWVGDNPSGNGIGG